MTNTSRIAAVTCAHVVVWSMFTVMRATGRKETLARRRPTARWPEGARERGRAPGAQVLLLPDYPSRRTLMVALAVQVAPGTSSSRPSSALRRGSSG